MATPAKPRKSPGYLPSPTEPPRIPSKAWVMFHEGDCKFSAIEQDVLFSLLRSNCTLKMYARELEEDLAAEGCDFAGEITHSLNRALGEPYVFDDALAAFSRSVGDCSTDDYLQPMAENRYAFALSSEVRWSYARKRDGTLRSKDFMERLVIGPGIAEAFAASAIMHGDIEGLRLIGSCEKAKHLKTRHFAALALLVGCPDEVMTRFPALQPTPGAVVTAVKMALESHSCSQIPEVALTSYIARYTKELVGICWNVFFPASGAGQPHRVSKVAHLIDYLASSGADFYEAVHQTFVGPAASIDAMIAYPELSPAGRHAAILEILAQADVRTMLFGVNFLRQYPCEVLVGHTAGEKLLQMKYDLCGDTDAIHYIASDEFVTQAMAAVMDI